jgi:hypothetical protein
MAQAPTLSTLSFHDGAAFEAGRTGRPRGEEDPEAEVVDGREHSPLRRSASPAAASPLRNPDARDNHENSQMGSSGAARQSSAGLGAATMSLRSSPIASPRAGRASARQEDDDLRATLQKPWRGQAESLVLVVRRVGEPQARPRQLQLGTGSALQLMGAAGEGRVKLL